MVVSFDGIEDSDLRIELSSVHEDYFSLRQPDDLDDDKKKFKYLCYS